jgi:hypothetical protein
MIAPQFLRTKLAIETQVFTVVEAGCRALQHWREYALTPYVVKNAFSFPFAMRARFARNLLRIFRRSARCSAIDLASLNFAASRANQKSGVELGLGPGWDPLTTRLGPPRGD